MNTEADLLNSLDEAQGRNPLEFPFGFYIEDDHEQSAGGSFFWYKTEKDMQQAIQNDFINALSDGASDDIAAVKAEIARLIEQSTPNAEGNDLLNSLNLFLREIELRLQFMGSFDDLCKSKNEWAKYFREFYREECLDDIDDISSKKLQSSIKKSEQDDFADFVSDYLI
ncbi:MAG: hypothetical protein LUQ26_03110 [Methylococcaceae bacterium]|nr:hypothetical protein [Methylococcaceae bacterium]